MESLNAKTVEISDIEAAERMQNASKQMFGEIFNPFEMGQKSTPNKHHYAKNTSK